MPWERRFEPFNRRCEEISLASNRKLAWVLSGILAVVSWQVAQGMLVPCDRVVAGWVSALRSLRSPAWDGLMRTVTFFGSSAWAPLALSLLGLWVWRRHGGRAAAASVGAFAIGVGLEIILRLAISQWRPDTMTLPSAMDWHTRFELAGFPSGHAYRSAFGFGWLMAEAGQLRGGGLVRWGSLAMIVAVGFSRLYLNRHWATDVLGGWLVAAVVLLIAQQVNPPSLEKNVS